MHPHIHERILLYKLQKGDTESFGKIYDFYHEKIYRYIYLKVPTQQDAEDITADTFLRAWQYIQERKSIRSLQAFLYQIARNLVVDFYRRRGARQESLDDNENEIVVADRTDLSLEEKMMLKSDIAHVESAIRQLKDVYRDVVILHYVNDIPVKEVARLVEKSHGATRVLLHRAVKTLRDLLQTTVEGL